MRQRLLASLPVLAALALACSSSGETDVAGTEQPTDDGTGGLQSVDAAMGDAKAGSAGATIGSGGAKQGTGGATGSGAATGSGGTTGSGGATGGGGTADPKDVVVNLAEVHQKMDGFGASDRNSGTLSDAQADLLFGAQGINLSLLRVSISPSGTPSTAASNATKAAARGAKVWAAPWTPPANFKDNCSRSNGGHLCSAAGQAGGCTCTGSHYDEWATLLAGFASVLKTQAGVDLYGLSVQNEPDYTAGYDSCLFSTAEMVAFVKVLGPKLAALSPRPKLMLPETSGWSVAFDHASAVLADGAAAPYLDIIATHQYFLDNPPAHAIPAGKAFWQTEDSSFEGYDASMSNALRVAGWIHNAIVTSGVSAWHYWELVNTSDNQGVYNGTSPAKRTFVLGNYSRFVRPGFDRVGVAGASLPAAVEVSAYANAADGTTALVIINGAASSASFSVFLSAASRPATMTPWVTSASDDLASKAPIAVSGGRFSVTVAAQSVTTLVGKP
jgi:glucuronoarabinoxylan endo-1,4-beta-xylanase